MKRRHFLRQSSLTAFALSTTGFIHFDGKRFVGDCQTTTDILGPFYRPDAPVRSNLVLEHMKGDIVRLAGSVFHDDCSTPIENAKVELWHCSADEVYDNDSNAYNYRGTIYSDASGHYHFRTQMPVPYDAGGGMYRPAHFHLMISAPGYQNLITQLYFSGDPYLQKDASSRTAEAESRTLTPEKDAEGNTLIPFNVIMQKQLPADPVALTRLAGMYKGEEDRAFDFFVHEDQLWMRNEVFGQVLRYLGNNTFEPPAGGEWNRPQLKFDIKPDGKVKLAFTIMRNNGEKIVHQAMKM
ncbi:MAG: catechol 1,2-dioxygenase [Saprospiraceae bacterium]|nr:catechol 1,2-dioxygenase [Saprospiraceae bacterium]